MLSSPSNRTLLYAGGFDGMEIITRVDIKHSTFSFSFRDRTGTRKYRPRHKLPKEWVAINTMKKYGGFCWICGELDVRILQNHHILGRKNSDLMVSLCANDHEKYRHQKPDIHVRLIFKAIENGVMFK